MTHAIKLNIDGDPNLGLYGIATDSFCLVGKTISKKQVEEIEKTLDVPVYSVKLYGTDLIGIFAVANSNGVLIPDIIFEKELEALKKLTIKFKTIKTEKTALNNTILCNDKLAFVSKEYTKKEVEEIKKALGVEIVQMDMANTHLPGSCGMLTNKGALFNQNLSDAEVKKIEKALGYAIGLGSINMGNNLVGSGLIANSNGFVAGSITSGHELMRVDEALRFI